MTKYIKISTISKPCHHCQGKGQTWEKMYHNQLRQCMCYKCRGTGQIEIDQHEDVTEMIERLIIKK